MNILILRQIDRYIDRQIERQMDRYMYLRIVLLNIQGLGIYTIQDTYTVYTIQDIYNQFQASVLLYPHTFPYLGFAAKWGNRLVKILHRFRSLSQNSFSRKKEKFRRILHFFAKVFVRWKLYRKVQTGRSNKNRN